MDDKLPEPCHTENFRGHEWCWSRAPIGEVSWGLPGEVFCALEGGTSYGVVRAYRTRDEAMNALVLAQKRVEESK